MSYAKSSRRSIFAATSLLLLGSIVVYVVEHEKHPYNTGGFAEKAALFERIANKQYHVTGVATSNGHAFQLMTGLPVPMSDDRTVDYVVVDLRLANKEQVRKLKLLDSVLPWAFCELPHSMTLQEAKRLGLYKPSP